MAKRKPTVQVARDKRVRVGFDLDDFIVPWYDPAHQLCVEKGVANGVRPTTWHPWEEYGCPKDEWVAIIDEAAASGRLYQAAPYPGVVEAMGKLAGNLPGWDIDIRIITARGFWAHGEIVREHTFNQLHTHKVPYSGLTFSQDKTVVRPMEFFGEDNLHNYDALEAAGTKAYLVDRPWNQVPGGDSRRRVPDVAAYVAAVMKELIGK